MNSLARIGVLTLALGVGACGSSSDSGARSSGGSGGSTGMNAGGGMSGSAGVSGSGGSGGMTGTGGTTSPPSGGSPVIPDITEPCPPIATGTINVLGQDVRLWVGARREDVKGPVFFYWHGTGSTANEATFGLGAALDEIQSMGGIVASFTTTTSTGTNTGNGVWHTGDFDMADIILACAIEQLNIDTRRVYTGGCSAGGLQSSAMVYERSSYLAGAMPNSGGIVFPYSLEDPNQVPAVITTHGAAGQDVVVIDFSETSARFVDDITAKGGFAVNCDHGGGHCASPTAVRAAQWEFLMAHPFGIDPSPYAGGLPGTFPNYCVIN